MTDSVESFLDMTVLERWPVQPQIFGDNPVVGAFNPMPVVGVNITNSARVAYNCIITIGNCSHTPAFRNHSLFSARQQSRGSDA